MSSPEIPQSTMNFYERMNQMNRDNARREDRRLKGYAMRLNAPALDEAAPWAIKGAGKRKSRRHKRTRKSRKSRKCRKSRRRH
jgi:hypothetical protein